MIHRYALLVTGGRDYVPTEAELDKLLWVHAFYRCTELVHGKCAGVDRAVDQFFAEHRPEVPRQPVPVELFGTWKETGPKLGPIRNAAMVAYVCRIGGGVCAAFRGGRGTADCVRKAQAAGLEVVRIGGVG